jgi:cell division protein FtsZ
MDYHDLERPAVLRRQSVSSTQAASTTLAPDTPAVADVDYLDIPAFLRRHEDA